MVESERGVAPSRNILLLIGFRYYTQQRRKSAKSPNCRLARLLHRKAEYRCGSMRPDLRIEGLKSGDEGRNSARPDDGHLVGGIKGEIEEGGDGVGLERGQTGGKERAEGGEDVLGTEENPLLLALPGPRPQQKKPLFLLRDLGGLQL